MHAQYIEYIISWVLVLNRQTTWIYSCSIFRWKSQLRKKYIEVKFPTIGAEFHNQIMSIAPVIPTPPCMGVVGLTIDRCIG